MRILQQTLVVVDISAFAIVERLKRWIMAILKDHMERQRAADVTEKRKQQSTDIDTLAFIAYMQE